MSSCFMISLLKTWKSTVLSWSLECWSPSTLRNLVFEKANHAQSNLALQKHLETTKNCFDRSVSNMVISMPDVFTQLNLLYRICISKISISPESHVYQISSLQFYNTYPLIVVNFYVTRRGFLLVCKMFCYRKDRNH